VTCGASAGLRLAVQTPVQYYFARGFSPRDRDFVRMVPVIVDAAGEISLRSTATGVRVHVEEK